MQIIKNTPTNPEILQRDGRILKAAQTGIILAVGWSIYTEYNFINSIAAKNLNTFLPAALDTVLHFLISVFSISIIEGTGLIMLAYLIDNILKKTLRSNLINCIGAGLLVVVCYSFAVGVSIGGIDKVSQKWVEAPALSSTSIIDSLAKQEKQGIQRTFSNDSLLVAVNYNNQIEAKKSEYSAKIAKLQTSKENYKRKEQRTGQSYISSRNYLQGKIEKLKSEQAQSIGSLQIAAGAELKELIKERKADTGAAGAEHKTEKQKINSFNEKSTKKYKNKIESTYFYMKYGIYFSLPLLLFCMILIRNIYFKAGITEQVQIDDYFYRDSILNKTKNLLRLKWLTFAHEQLDKRFDKLKEVNYSPRINKVFDRTDLTQYVNPLQLDNSQMNLDDVKAAFPVKNNNGLAVKNNHGKTDENTATTQTVVTQKQAKTDKIKCLKTGCKKTFLPFPKSKKFCSTKCRVQHHNFELR
jgi:hypothetical protein